MFQPGNKVGVAVSGGADSVCLLHVLREFDLRLHVLHLNHNLRGDESRDDAEFVRQLAGALQLPCTIREANFADSFGNLEQDAREARLGFFREVISSGLVDRVALGHTRSDQAETVLFRFLRGSGTAGLAGIRPVTADGIVRPLFDVERAEVEGFLRDRGICLAGGCHQSQPPVRAQSHTARAAAATGARLESQDSRRARANRRLGPR